MSQNNKASYPCEPCGLQTFERNRYFDGKLLVTRDFQDEQAYLRGKDRLHNSLLHGYGTVCGLEVEQHPAEACRYKYVVLNPGLALDCCGNEIVVPERQVVKWLDLIDAALKEKGSSLKSLQDETEEQRKRRIIHLRLAYQECDTEKVPALLDDCGCDETSTEFNRTRESYRLFAEVMTQSPEEASAEPIDARLEWQHTLSVAEPKAMVVDRSLKRLYVADYIAAGEDAGGWLRTYDTDTHRLISRLSIGFNRVPTAGARSNFGERIYIADYGSVVPYGYGYGEALAIGGELLEPENELLASAGEEFPVRIRVFNRTDLEDGTVTTATVLEVPGTSRVVRLETSNGDNSLYALTQEGRLFHWSTAEIERKVADPTATVTYTEHDLRIRLAQLGQLRQRVTVEYQPSSPVVLNLVDMSQSPEGQWLVIADTQGSQLIVLFLPQFDALALAWQNPDSTNPSQLSNPSQLENLLQVFSVPTGEYPNALTINYQGNALYLLCTSLQDPTNPAIELPTDATKKLYRLIIQDQPELSTYLPEIPAAGVPEVPGLRDLVSVLELKDKAGAITTSLPIDLEVSPRDNWVYVLRRLFNIGSGRRPLDRNDVLIVSVKNMALHQIWNAVDAEGDARFQNLAFLGQRLYVAGLSPTESTDGSISILYVDETTCDNFILQNVEEGCATCDEPSQGIILATVEGYRLNEPFVNPRINDTDNWIDNFTYRPMVPSTNTLKRVIQCMLEKGISEGVPGPPGQRGPQGNQGAQGSRGSGITEVLVSTLAPGSSATASLQPIPGDPESDQRLQLGIPRGATGNQGAQGSRGPGITEVLVSTLAPGSPATASLQPIPGDPEGDQRLLLGVPQGESGAIQPGNFNQVINASWHLDEVLTIEDLQKRFVEEGPGLVVAFANPVLVRTLHDRSVFILVQRSDNQGFLIESQLPITSIEPVDVIEKVDTGVNWLIEDTPTPDNFGLIHRVKPHGNRLTQAVRITPSGDWVWEKLSTLIREFNIQQLKVVLRGDWILDENNRGLDGHHIWPGVPEGPTAAIGADGDPIFGRPSGDGTEGGDWISIIHIQS